MRRRRGARSVSSFPRSVATSCARGPGGSMGGSRMSSAAAMSACAGTNKVLAHLMFGMTVLTASQLMRLIVPADLVRLVSFAITAAVLPVRRCGQTRLKLGENTESEAASTLIRPWSRSKSRQLPCADVAASLGVLAPLRIDQSFASGSVGKHASRLCLRDLEPWGLWSWRLKNWTDASARPIGAYQRTQWRIRSIPLRCACALFF